MKEKIAIIGGGQAGLQLAIALKRKNFSVSLVTNRSAQQLRSGSILSSQGMFDSALSVERSLGIDFWQEKAPQNNALTFTLSNPADSTIAIQWQSKIQSYQSVDQRIKFSHWMDIFEKEGGKLVVKDLNVQDLDEISQSNDLTIISAGKGEISQLFPRNEKESRFTSPQRMLSCIYVNDVVPANPAGVRANIIPGIGEFFVIPGLTLNGHCEMMLFEGIPNGPFDCWKDIKTVEEQFRTGLALLEKFAPWEAKRFRNAKPTDKNAGLIGSYTPTVRHPTAKLPSGKFVLGIGDAVVLNDPIAGQGANNACKAAHVYAENIINHSGNAFDEMWMKKTFQQYWDNHGKWATQWSNMLLTPPPPHIIELLQAASRDPHIAHKLAYGFDTPSTLFPWILDPVATHDMITPRKTLAFN
ncbi:MAG: styrene monooxygenase/indole monooxygenase family protein [Gammaproteobacteria bacterium]|nr:styrene monooxygenase/indole monooxygenase family protein [Gammaproteobacteria bacterium]